MGRAAEIGDQPRRQSAPGSADQDAGLVDAVAATTTVDDGGIRALAGQDLHLFQRCGEGMPVIGIARKAAHADHEALVQRGGNADLAAEFAAPHLALSQAAHLGRLQGVDPSRAEQVILFRQARAVLHWQDRICKVSKGIIQNLARHG